jgi:hypothetical protein
MSDYPQTTKAWETGAVGEERLGARLDRLTGDGIHVLHDRRIPRTQANIDHIVVCSSGVYVIDAKKYRGRPNLRVEGGIIRPRVEKLLVGTRDCTKLVDGILKQVNHVRIALDEAGLEEIQVAGMLCFVDADWPLIGGDFIISSVRVLWPRKAVDHITKTGVVNAPTAQHVFRALAAAFPAIPDFRKAYRSGPCESAPHDTAPTPVSLGTLCLEIRLKLIAKAGSSRSLLLVAQPSLIAVLRFA